MQGNCLVTTNMRIEEVLAQAPRGKKAMFRVVSAPSSVKRGFIDGITLKFIWKRFIK
jgi:hypothetical protein